MHKDNFLYEKMDNFLYILLILLAVSFIIYLFWGKSDRKQEDKAENSQFFQLRLQALERFILFLERSRPESLLLRFTNKTTTATELQLLLLSSVREEFEHNFSQQLYVSEGIWKAVTYCKDDLLRSINLASEGLTENTSTALAKNLLTNYTEKNPYTIDTTLAMVRKEAKVLLEKVK